MRCRSMLFTPAHQPNKIARALSSDADVIVLDCEDSVPTLTGKAAAFDAITALDTVRPFWVRIPQAVPTPRYVLARCRGLVLPKLQSAAQVKAELDTLSMRIGMLLQAFVVIENPAAVVNAAAIAQVPGVVGLIYGPYDMAASMGRRMSSFDDDYPRGATLYAAKAAGKKAIDTRPHASVLSYIEGWDGLALLHPGQVAEANRMMGPTANDLAWAQGIVADPNPEVHIQPGGQLVAPPVRALAQRILSDARRY